MEFVKANVNPKGKKTGDCVVRAIVQATCMPYAEVMKMMFDISIASGYSFASRQVAESLLTKLGFEKHKKPFKPSGKTYCVAEAAMLLEEDDIAVLNVANHFTCVKGGKLIDLWDCSSKSIYGYFTKKAKSMDELNVYGARKIEETYEIALRKVRI